MGSAQSDESQGGSLPTSIWDGCCTARDNKEESGSNTKTDFPSGNGRHAVDTGMVQVNPSTPTRNSKTLGSSNNLSFNSGQNSSFNSVGESPKGNKPPANWTKPGPDSPMGSSKNLVRRKSFIGPEVAADWTEQQQSALEYAVGCVADDMHVKPPGIQTMQALRQDYLKSGTLKGDNSKFWTKVALAVPDKSPNQCFDRYFAMQSVGIARFATPQADPRKRRGSM